MMKRKTGAHSPRHDRSMMGWLFRGFMVFLCGFLSMLFFSILFLTLLPMLNFYGYSAFAQDEQSFWCYYALPFGAANVLFLYGGVKAISRGIKKLWSASRRISEKFFEKPAG